MTYGVPVRRRYELSVSRESFRRWSAPERRKGQGEVVLFVLRNDGNLILHTKDFYPPGAFRVPTGGILEHEPLLKAALREALEETGLTVAVERFLAIAEFEFRCEGKSIRTPSYLFLLREVGGQLKAQDLAERIAGFTEVAPSALLNVAGNLERLPPDWRDWGLYRAIPHRLAAEVLCDSILSASAAANSPLPT